MNLAGRASRCIASRSFSMERIIELMAEDALCSSRSLRLKAPPKTSRGTERPTTGDGGGAGG